LDQWFSARNVGMIFGAGGVGKTLLAQQLGACVAMGKPFQGIETKQMPVLAVLCEDDITELSRRQLSINNWLHIDEFSNGPKDLYLWPRVGEDNIMLTFPSQGEAEPAKFYKTLCEAVERKKGTAADILVILDTAADFFGGNENVRRETNSFIKTYLGALCVQYNATVILLAHPSLSGLASGTGMSGSTAWENSVRSRAYMYRVKDNDAIRILSRKKSNYSEIGTGTDITLLWENGVLIIPETEEQRDIVTNRVIKEMILDAVDAAQARGNPIMDRTQMGYKIALPGTIPKYPRGVIVSAFKALVEAGIIVKSGREGYETVRSQKPIMQPQVYD